MNIAMIERARRYIATMPPSIQGCDGRNSLFKVALKLVKGLCLSEVEAFPILAEWNQTNSIPPWSDTELRHKLRDASKAKVPDGYLLKDNNTRQQGNRRSPQCLTPMVRGAESQVRIDQEAHAEKARKRSLWPTFKRPTDNELLAIAKLRSLPVEAVDMARAAGFLWSTRVDGAACFVIREGDHFAQARRYDKLPFTFGNGSVSKAKTLPGSLSAGFVGWDRLGDPDCPVLIVEGVVGLLEGIAALRSVNADARPGAGWSVLAAISCESRFAKEPCPIPDLTGRRFRILPDHDEGDTGFRAAASWQNELISMGATADAYPLPEKCKDLGPVMANIEAHREYLTQIFTI
jgi:hypothetical protein